MQNYNISKAFMAAAGVSVSYGITNSSTQEYDIKQTAVKRSQQVFLLVDSSKFDAISLMTYCQLNQIDTIITDSAPHDEYTSYINKNSRKIVYSGS